MKKTHYDNHIVFNNQILQIIWGSCKSIETVTKYLFGFSRNLIDIEMMELFGSAADQSYEGNNMNNMSNIHTSYLVQIYMCLKKIVLSSFNSQHFGRADIFWAELCYTLIVLYSVLLSQDQKFCFVLFCFVLFREELSWALLCYTLIVLYSIRFARPK
jgi:hypothetical protein